MGQGGGECGRGVWQGGGECGRRGVGQGGGECVRRGAGGEGSEGVCSVMYYTNCNVMEQISTALS